MALITNGSINSFSATVASSVLSKKPYLEAFRTLSEIGEATRSVQPAPLDFNVSTTTRGLALKSLKFTQGFEGFLGNLFKDTNEVYFLAWAWDMSGNPIVEYPGVTATDKTCIIPLRTGQIREFLGSGICLFPARQVTAGLAVRIMIWESDQNTRTFGKAMSEIANTIKASKLNNLLSLIAMSGVSTATIALIKDAAVELADLIGQILQANSDDYVDFYEGYYPVSGNWTAGDEIHQGNASEIVLARFT
jgi:hypothetical protein